MCIWQHWGDHLKVLYTEKVGKVSKHYVKQKHLEEIECWRQTTKAETIQENTVHRFC